MIKFLILVSVSFFNPEIKHDSIGMETINGKPFVVHKIERGETLYSISKRYGVTVDQILEHNPDADAGLEVDHILKVPYFPRAPKKQSPNANTHIVAEKETLFSISRHYGITVDELKQWNNLTDNSLALGQELIIKRKNTLAVSPPLEVKSQRTVHTVAAKETMFSITRQYGITVDQLRAWNNLTTDELKIGQTLYVAQPIYNQTQQVTTTTATQPATTQSPTQTQSQTQPPAVVTPIEISPTIKISESVRGSDEIIEAGLAELIEGTEGNRKYLALHRTAPVGTILRIKNEMNSREVFVRVMGKLPDTAATDKLVIKISKSAYDRLGAIDSRFRVEVTYYK
ncbi:MAG TPA: LysM peptidoglycan-binding domain-containing protein [Cyclobacteriaceae bacterium]|nr:LysM peptidoglycan-binding domain-containing protein [Cyclobacteriaceae bacterium]